MPNLVHRIFRSQQCTASQAALSVRACDRLRTPTVWVAACAALACLSPWVEAQTGVAMWGSSTGVPPPPAGTSYVEISVGNSYVLFRLSNGEIVEWSGLPPASVPPLPPGVSYVEVAAGSKHALARRSDGQVVAWGENGDGQCNVPPLPPGVTYVEIAAGSWHSLARRSDGTLAVWGDSSLGQFNVPPLPPGVTYVEIDTGLKGSGSTGEGGHNVARRSDGQVVAWGDNGDGQCNVPPLPTGVTYTGIAAADSHTLARRSDGQIVGWGWNEYGQCAPPALPPGVVYVDVAAGGWHSLARRSDNQVVAWGWNLYGQCNVPPPPAGAAYVELEAGFFSSLARYEPTCPEPVVYCTAKTNSLGCSPSISMTGFANATAGVGCTVSAANLVGQKVGIYLHSTSGGAALPLHGGTLCVQAPFKRHPATSTGGTVGVCDGVLSEDFNAYIASGADPALVAGATFWIQAWSRDPGDAFGDSLSNALSAVLCP